MPRDALPPGVRRTKLDITLGTEARAQLELLAAQQQKTRSTVIEALILATVKRRP
jgi:hypothetical protein